MKLVMYHEYGDPRLGVLDGETVVDLNLAYEAMLAAKGDLRARPKADAIVPAESVAFLQGGEESMAAARAALDFARANSGLDVRGIALSRPLADVRLKAPVLKPEKIICVAHNFHDFLKEIGMKPHAEPRIFSKFANAVAGWDEPVIRPAMSDALGYEAELSFVIGKRCKNVPESEAYDVIAAYMTSNDVSASDLTKRDVQEHARQGL